MTGVLLSVLAVMPLILLPVVQTSLSEQELARTMRRLITGEKYKGKVPTLTTQNERLRFTYGFGTLSVLLTIAAAQAAKTKLTTCTSPSPPGFPKSVT